MDYANLILNLKNYREMLNQTIEDSKKEEVLSSKVLEIMENIQDVDDFLKLTTEEREHFKKFLRDIDDTKFNNLFRQMEYFSKLDSVRRDRMPQYSSNITWIAEMMREAVNRINTINSLSYKEMIKSLIEQQSLYSEIIESISEEGFVKVIDQKEHLDCIRTFFEHSSYSEIEKFEFLKELSLFNIRSYQSTINVTAENEVVEKEQELEEKTEDELEILDVGIFDDIIVPEEMQLEEPKVPQTSIDNKVANDQNSIAESILRDIREVSDDLEFFSQYFEEDKQSYLKNAVIFLENNADKIKNFGKKFGAANFYDIVSFTSVGDNSELKNHNHYFWIDYVLRTLGTIVANLGENKKLITSSENPEEKEIYISLLYEDIEKFNEIFTLCLPGLIDKGFITEEMLQNVTEEKDVNNILFLLDKNGQPYAFNDLETLDTGKIPSTSKTLNSMIRNLRKGNFSSIKQSHSNKFYDDYRVEIYRQFTEYGVEAIAYVDVDMNTILIIGSNLAPRSSTSDSRYIDRAISSRMNSSEYLQQLATFTKILNSDKRDELLETHRNILLEHDPIGKGDDSK